MGGSEGHRGHGGGCVLMDSSCSRFCGMFGGKVNRKLKTDEAFD